jgi:hypothetical protein
LIGFTCLVIIFAAVGVVLSVTELADGNVGAVTASPSLSTSFGFVVVKDVELLELQLSTNAAGHSHTGRDVAGVDQVQIRVSVVLENQRDRAVNFSPDDFRLVAYPGDVPVDPFDVSFGTGILEPDSSVTVTISFFASKDADQYWLAFEETGHAESSLVYLGDASESISDGAGGVPADEEEDAPHH